MSPVAVFMCEARALLWTIASLVQHHSAQARARTQREIKTAERRKRAGRKKDAERASSSEAFSVTHFKWLLHFNIHGEALHQVRISRGGGRFHMPPSFLHFLHLEEHISQCFEIC